MPLQIRRTRGSSAPQFPVGADIANVAETALAIQTGPAVPKFGADSAATTLGASVNTQGAFRTRYGLRVQDPDVSSASSTYASYNDLDPLRGLSQPQLQDLVNTEFSGYAGVSGAPLFGITTEYARTIGSGVLSSFGSSMLDLYGAHCMSLLASDWNAFANPNTTTLNSIQAMCNALPSGVPIYLIFVNEPDRDSPDGELYCNAFARFAAEVITRRGSKLLYPATAYTKLSLVNQQNQPVAGRDVWNPAPAMEALGLDPGQDAVMAQHGYSQDPTDPTDFWQNMFNPCYALYRSWGFTRMGFSEGASKNRVGTQFTAMSGWLDGLAAGVRLNQLEFFVYYHSGGSGGIAAPEGWWIAGAPYGTLDNRNKIKYAQIARDNGIRGG